MLELPLEYAQLAVIDPRLVLAGTVIAALSITA